MPSEFQYDVFLSHNSKDKAVVRPLAERVRTCRAEAAGRRRKDGLKVWFDEWVLKPGDSIPAKIDPPSLKSYGATREGLEHSRVLVLCMSANAVGSDWAKLAAGTSGRDNLPFRAPLNQEPLSIPQLAEPSAPPSWLQDD
jgi:hypothetical protein